MTFDVVTVLFLLAGAGSAAFVAGFAGFGTALMASGLYFHVLPAGMVPPLVVLGSVIAHVVVQIINKAQVDLRPSIKFLVPGVVGVPIGVAMLGFLTPDALRGIVGTVLVAYCVATLTGILKPIGTHLRTTLRDGTIGGIGGVLGGIAGLSGVLPMVWLQLAMATPGESRAILQGYNMALLTLASAVMWLNGLIAGDVWTALLITVPASVAGAVAGNWAFGKASPATFRRVVLALLLISGVTLLGRVLTG